MEGVLSRLEAVTTRLESYERGLQNTAGVATGAARSASATVPKQIPPKPAATASPEKPVIISTDPPKTITMADWDSLISKELGALSAARDKLPEQFQSSSKHFASAAEMMVDVVRQSRNCRKPTMEEFSAIVAPMGAAMQDIEGVIRGPKTPATNHHRALSECVQSFAWVTLDAATGAPPPGAMLAESQAGADMFINRIIMEHRQSAPEHKDWALALKAFMARLQVMASSQFPQGLTWVGTAAPGPLSASAPGAQAPAPSSASDVSSASALPATPAVTEVSSRAATAVAESSAVSEDGGEFQDADSAAGGAAPAAASAPATSYHTATSATNTLAADSEAEEPTAASNGVDDPTEASAAPEAAPEEAPEASAVAAPVAAPGGPPPPPPPPPAGMLLEKLSNSATASAAAGGSGNARGELMAALNKGGGVTSGLKKVTDDMKTKNQANRSGVVKAVEAPTAAKKDPKAAKGPPCKDLKQNRWLVENWVACEDPVVLEEGEVQRSHAVYISNCSQCVVQVKGKVNTIMLDGCSKVGLVFNSVLATVEAVNCQSCQIQCELTCPTLSIDKTDGAKVFLSEEAAAATEVVTSKCSALTVTVLPKEAEADPVEHPVPEQFVSKIVDGKMVTTPVVHM